MGAAVEAAVEYPGETAPEVAPGVKCLCVENPGDVAPEFVVGVISFSSKMLS